MDFIDWLKTAKFRREYRRQVPVKFIVDRLDYHAHSMIFLYDPMPERARRIEEALDSGVEPLDFQPINLCFYAKEDRLHVIDGTHRIQTFHKRGIQTINSRFRMYWSEETILTGYPWETKK